MITRVTQQDSNCSSTLSHSEIVLFCFVSLNLRFLTDKFKNPPFLAGQLCGCTSMIDINNNSYDLLSFCHVQDTVVTALSGMTYSSTEKV